MTGPACVLLAEEVWGGALHAMRSVAGLGAPVYVATAGEGTAVYRRSRFCSGALDLCAATPDGIADELVTWIDAIVPGDQPVVVIPLSDRLVEVLHRTRSRFGSRYRLSVPEPGVTEALLDKASSFELAEAAGLAVPAWTRVASLDDLGAAAALRLPVAVRPTSWSTAGSEYFKVVRCDTAGDLEQTLRRHLALGATVVVQEYVQGTDRDVELSILWRGRVHGRVAVCTGRKERQASPDGGVMVWGRAEDLADIRRLSEAWLEHTGFTGLGGLEFLRSAGVPWFIEFNPRAEAIHFLGTAAGIDTVAMEYRSLAFGQEPETVPNQLPATAWVGSAWLARVQARPRDLPSALGDRWSFGRSPGRVRAVWSRSDPGPGVAVSLRLIRRGLRRAGRRRSGSVAS